MIVILSCLDAEFQYCDCSRRGCGRVVAVCWLGGHRRAMRLVTLLETVSLLAFLGSTPLACECTVMFTDALKVSCWCLCCWCANNVNMPSPCSRLGPLPTPPGYCVFYLELDRDHVAIWNTYGFSLGMIGLYLAPLLCIHNWSASTA